MASERKDAAGEADAILAAVESDQAALVRLRTETKTITARLKINKRKLDSTPAGRDAKRRKKEATEDEQRENWIGMMREMLTGDFEEDTKDTEEKRVMAVIKVAIEQLETAGVITELTSPDVARSRETAVFASLQYIFRDEVVVKWTDPRLTYTSTEIERHSTSCGTLRADYTPNPFGRDGPCCSSWALVDAVRKEEVIPEWAAVAFVARRLWPAW